MRWPQLAVGHSGPADADGRPVDPQRVTRVGAVHRVGVLTVGEVAVVAVAVAPHRAEAFTACSDLIERLKHEVPIWKRQRFSDGLSRERPPRLSVRHLRQRQLQHR